jgi:hypothetical protein
MGYGLTVFLVSRNVLDRVPRKGDAALLAQALEAAADGLADHDEQSGAPDLENYDIDISHADALRELFTGQFTEGVTNSRYGWAFEALCAALGDRLDNREFVPCKLAWYEKLDALLAANGVPLRFLDLIYRPPIPLPEADDWPCVGHWGRDDLKALDALAEFVPGVSDPEMQRALASALDWLRAAAARPHTVIVGFHG